jgi:hypothetical protein
MCHRIAVATIVLLAKCVPILGQGMTLVGAAIGAWVPEPRVVVPGQIVTLHVANVKTVLPSSVLDQAHATSLPLPTSIAGFSVTIRTLYNEAFTAPLFRIGQRTP